MDKPPRKRLSGWINPRVRKDRKNKVDSNQLVLTFPAIQANLSLDEKEAFFLPRRRQENDWKVKRYWEGLVIQKGFIKQLAKGQKIWIRPGYGLIYRHLVDDKVRYIGQTSRWSLRERLKQRFSNGLIGYDYDIQRCLLNALWRKSWKIRTEEVDLKQLDQREEELIRFYARLNRLWNRQSNPYFHESNFDI